MPNSLLASTVLIGSFRVIVNVKIWHSFVKNILLILPEQCIRLGVAMLEYTNRLVTVCGLLKVRLSIWPVHTGSEYIHNYTHILYPLISSKRVFSINVQRAFSCIVQGLIKVLVFVWNLILNWSDLWWRLVPIDSIEMLNSR